MRFGKKSVWLGLIIGGVLTQVTAMCGVPSVEETMDGVVARLFDTLSEGERAALDDDRILSLLSPEEKNSLAKQHVRFKVDIPVVVSVMRDADQPVVPFWLPETGFIKTEMTVVNDEEWVYEVWQKNYEPGWVELGINGFDKHRPHYFVSVGPRNEGDKVEISDLHPSEFSVDWMREGAFTYHDWDTLTLKTVPREIRGHRLLTTIRGRARAAHLIGGFRITPYPSSESPDQILLTWSEDPKTTQTIQWRTSPEVEKGVVRYRKVGESTRHETEATRSAVEDRFLANDPTCHRFTAVLRNLEPGTRYTYQVGSPESGKWSEESEFQTAPAGPEPFTFLSFGDTHNQERWGEMLEKVEERHPESAFFAVAGDLVGTGQYRDDWDKFFHLCGSIGKRIPLVPTLGNHDIIDGLGAGMYLALFGLPENGPNTIEPERAFAFEYGDLLFVSLDSGLSALDQAEWLEETLAGSDAKWKIAMYHFPPYSYAYPYPEIESLWGYLFDKYNVNFALEGHIHYYMRSRPIRRGRPVENPKDGRIHLISIPIPNRERDLPPADFVGVQYSGIEMYQTFKIDGDRLEFKAYDIEGNILDELTIEK